MSIAELEITDDAAEECDMVSPSFESVADNILGNDEIIADDVLYGSSSAGSISSGCFRFKSNKDVSWEDNKMKKKY